jgi:hypothetical protein
MFGQAHIFTRVSLILIYPIRIIFNKMDMILIYPIRKDFFR